MNFDKSLRAFLSELPIQKMSGHQKLLAVVAHFSGGDISEEVALANVNREWPRSTLKCAYSPKYYVKADEAGWINSSGKGYLKVTKDGIEHLSALFESKEIMETKEGEVGLRIFDKKQTHSFDKFIRGVFAQAKKRVWIADAYVDERIFDTVLDVIPATVDFDLIYNNKQGAYDARIARFRTQYPKFITKQYPDLHDRFFIIDNIGYVIGPSLKDAAMKSPALVVVLNEKDSLSLIKFFQLIKARAK
ncbi:MAG: hypothetical protein HY432_00020 [Candidatus Liptonbacteria bacterium]|nr:hypothetical protein [Candidatus Liptonbacteria bacterium]